MSQNYFVRRELPVGASYEEAYWGVVKDPDGNVRDRRLERERYLGDIKVELAFINALPAGRMLDIGCGLGFLLSGVADSWERHGVEVSEFAIEHASHYGHIYQGCLENAGYPDQHFDLVVIYHVIEHVQNPQKLLKEIRRILKPDGWLILGTPDFDSGAARRFGENYRMLHDTTHISLFSNDSMHRFLRDHGFRIEWVEYPYFETRYFNQDNLLALLDTSKVSPPFYGNFMTFYCQREALPELKERVQGLSNYLSCEGEVLRLFQQDCTEALTSMLESGLSLCFQGKGAMRPIAGLLADRLAELGSTAIYQADTALPAQTMANIVLTYTDGALRVTLPALGLPTRDAVLACPEDLLLLAMLFEDMAARVGDKFKEATWPL
ncbi:class I SAM-dependent methyltransferase [Stutzerimonas nitrititolerans]|uniref:class I SAM-dependent methyltransferase n=1 Tax=Stutzerimonas nitrititolerans TaxID=2482751 RepID=UPI0028AB91AA|nr:class I SAM-dependent methyltransferase [Stutzerimonas nitrititolerans]